MIDISEQIIYKLCSELDRVVYLPVKKELSTQMIQHSLGPKKENYKGIIETTIEEKLLETQNKLKRACKISFCINPDVDFCNECAMCKQSDKIVDDIFGGVV